MHKAIIKIVCLGVLCVAMNGCSLFEPDPPEPVTAPPTRSALSNKHINPEAERIYAKARVLWSKGDACEDPEKAIAFLNSALELEPEYSDALYRRGLAFWQLGHPEEGFEDLTKSIQLVPSAEVYAWRAQLLLTEGNAKGAQQDAERALQLNDATPRAHGVLGAILLDNNEESAACRKFARAADLGMDGYLQSARTTGICK